MLSALGLSSSMLSGHCGDDYDYNSQDANGFIRVNAVRLKTYAALRAKDSE